MAVRKRSSPMPGRPLGNVVYHRWEILFIRCGGEPPHPQHIGSRATANRPNFKFFDTTKVVFRCTSGGVPPGLGGLQMNNAPADGDRNCLGAVVRAQLLHDVFDVNLDRPFRNEETLGYVTVTVALSNLLQDLNLT